MTVVAALLLPGSPLPYVQRDNPPWGSLADAMEAAGSAVATAEPDTIVVYSTQWFAVLDQLWQYRAHIAGEHVDENWHEYGELPFDIRIDRELTDKCIALCEDLQVRAREVDYDEFPIDTGTIMAANFLNPDRRYQFAITSNNLYHDWDLTEGLGRTAATAAANIGRRIAVVGVGGLSGSFFRHTIDIADDRLASPEDDQWNQRILDLMTAGKVAELREICPRFAAEAKADMGFKHFAFLLGAIGGTFRDATVHGYGPLYGAGGAVVEFNL